MATNYRYSQKAKLLVPAIQGGSIVPGMTIKVYIKRYSDNKVFNFVSLSWVDYTLGPDSDLWKILVPVYTDSVHTTFLGYEYNGDWTFPENVSTNGTPEKFVVFYKKSTDTYSFQTEELLYLPVSATFDWMVISPLDVGAITILGG